jgi:hypothetical protein
MAAEAVGLRASVLAFIGLAGQIVSGCQFISNLVDDTKDAREDLRTLSHEVKILQDSVIFFQNTLLLLDQNGTSKDILNTAKPIFEEIFQAIEHVQGFITRHKAKDSTWKEISKWRSRNSGLRNSSTGFRMPSQASILFNKMQTCKVP